MPIRGLFPAIDTAASGLTAQRQRMNTAASNIANVSTTRTDEGGPYKRKTVILRQASGSQGFRATLRKVRLYAARRGHMSGMAPSSPGDSAAGVRVEAIREVNSPPKMVYDPSHPDADATGYVAMPNVNVMTEMVDMMEASRAYEAGIAVITTAKSQIEEALRI